MIETASLNLLAFDDEEEQVVQEGSVAYEVPDVVDDVFFDLAGGSA